ncbi:MAG: selenium cofactor biosynthesis protein YqeC [Cetobacterium sp.]|uniref:selenium cofactor biosynthesis protein YqeC n=1 Tax=Cetobacterium sp. TaxID=2071632 RepID=UPI002FCC48D1
MIELFDINKGDVVSITGAGGKTSLMFFLADSLSKKGTVLITTTTKIFKPECIKKLNLIFISPEEIDYISPQDSSIYIYCPNIIDNKIQSASFEDVAKLEKKFDYILIEADGSCGKPLKGWKENEPSIPTTSKKTIAVIDITALKTLKSESSIHRFNLYTQQFPQTSEIITKEDFINYIDSNLFFKNSYGRNILFFNKIESLEFFEYFFDIANSIKNKDVYFGSIFDGLIHKFKNVTPIVLASGFSRRFGANKLDIRLKNSMTLLEQVLFNITKLNFKEKILVGKEHYYLKLANNYSFKYIENEHSHLGQSQSVILGTKSANLDGFIFIPGDMPFLSKNSLLTLIWKFQIHNKIIVPFINDQKCAPVLFPKKYSKILLELKGDAGGKEIISKNIFIKCTFKNSMEFFDIDTKEDLKLLEMSEENL